MAQIFTLLRASLFGLATLLLAFTPEQASAQDECGAYSGAITTDAGPICLVNGAALLTGYADGSAVVPAGFITTYVLTRTNGLIIEQVGPSPNFSVNTVDVWRIHALVFDPTTLDLSTLQLGSSNAYDVQGLITQGGGAICASLSMSSADIKTAECEDPCLASASEMAMDSSTVCLEGGQATLTAIQTGASNVPVGFEELYVLTRTNGLIIEQVSATPTFTVNSTDAWRIHSLVYDPATLDLSTITFGVTSAYDVQSLLLQGGGSICASLDISGAFVKTGECTPTCFAEAGVVSADQADLCLMDDLVLLNATPDGNATVPDGYELIYFLTDVNDIPVILSYGSSPGFYVNGVGLYGIHPFVYDPATFDLASVIIGETTLLDLSAQFLQGGGNICASLDLDGAEFQVTLCTPGCEADAGAMAGEAQILCLEEGGAVLSATSFGDTLVPPGFVMGYWLSQGPELVLMDWSTEPLFTVYEADVYHIHAFVNDPTTFDTSMIAFGTTTGYELNEMLMQGGGSLCASLDVMGAKFTVSDCAPQCDAGSNAEITICKNDTAFLLFDLLDGDPCPGGTWMAPNETMFSGVFDPEMDAAGIYSYTVDDINGDTHMATITVNVNECTIEEMTMLREQQLTSTEEITTAVEDHGQMNSMTIWPNPANERINITLPFISAEAIEVELIDATGRIVPVQPTSTSMNVLTLDVTTLTSGAWIVRITSKKGMYTGRFIR